MLSSYRMSLPEIELLLSKIDTGTLLATLDRETQAAVFEQRYIRQPLVTPSSEREAKLLDRMLDRMMYDVYTGKFIYTRTKGRIIRGHEAGYLYTSPKGDRIVLSIDNKDYPASHLVMLLITGRLPEKGELVDHKNGNATDDTIGNLYPTDYIGNARNTKKRKDNKTGFVGVHYHNQTGRYMAYVRNKYLGIFSTIPEANEAREAYLAKHPELGFTYRHGK